jgi:hypothetical protein
MVKPTFPWPRSFHDKAMAQHDKAMSEHKKVMRIVNRRGKDMSEPTLGTYIFDEMIDNMDDTLVDGGGCEMSEGYHGFEQAFGRGAAQDPNTWESSGPPMPSVKPPKEEPSAYTVNAEGVRDIRRVVDDLRVYSDKLTTDVKIPRRELKDIIVRLNNAVGTE